MQVSVSIIRDIIYSAVQAGTSLERVCRAASISSAELQEDRTYNLGQVNAVWLAALTETADPLLGLHIGERVNFESIGIVGFTMQNSPSLLTALERAAHYQNIYSTLLEITLRQEGAMVTIRFSPLPVFSHSYPVAARQAVESSMAFAARSVVRLSGKRISPRWARFQFPAPERRYVAEYEKLFDAVLRFGESVNELQYTAQDLQWPVLTYNQGLYQLLNEEAGRRLQIHQQGKAYTERVRQVLLSLLEHRYAGIEQVAEAMNTSVRTLQRKLREEGETFGQLLENLQQAYARRYLEASTLSVAEIGYLLGYAEPGVFTRAFKRWTGLNPSEYRIRSVALNQNPNP